MPPARLKDQPRSAKRHSATCKRSGIFWRFLGVVEHSGVRHNRFVGRDGEQMEIGGAIDVLTLVREFWNRAR
jgi:hypothetical protein